MNSAVAKARDCAVRELAHCMASIADSGDRVALQVAARTLLALLDPNVAARGDVVDLASERQRRGL